MTFADMAALFGAMLVLAAAPSVSVMLVAGKSVASGFSHGASAAMGVVAGDLVFILVAVFGLVFLMEVMGDTVFLLKYVAAGYLVWLGVRFWRSRGQRGTGVRPEHTSLKGSFMAGLFLTLADQKAVLFYLAFLPAFVDLAAISWADLGVLVVITIVAVGGVKLAYAYAAGRAGALLAPAIGKKLDIVAAVVMLSAAVLLIVRF